MPFYRSIKLPNDQLSLFYLFPLLLKKKERYIFTFAGIQMQLLHYLLQSPLCLPPLTFLPHQPYFFTPPLPPFPPFLSFILCLEVSAKRASFSEKQKEGIDWVISCCSGGPFDQNWKAALHVRILLQQLFLSFTITTRHGHIQSFPSLSPHSVRVRACGDERYHGSFCFLLSMHWERRLC